MTTACLIINDYNIISIVLVPKGAYYQFNIMTDSTDPDGMNNLLAHSIKEINRFTEFIITNSKTKEIVEALYNNVKLTLINDERLKVYSSERINEIITELNFNTEFKTEVFEAIKVIEEHFLVVNNLDDDKIGDMLDIYDEGDN